jgi:adenosylcobinamide-GDP ribazoletransferase
MQTFIKRAITGFTAAWTFLTIIPLPGCQTRQTAADMAASSAFFPLVGLGLGLLTVVGWSLLSPFFDLPASQPLLALLMAGLLLLLSGGLHLDGLSDTADGFFSARSRERILEIMRDSRIGVMGVIGVVAVLGCKVLALAAIGGKYMWMPLLLMPVTGRTAILLQMALLAPARSGDGLANLFYDRLSRRELTRAASLASLFVLAVSWLIAGGGGLLASAAALAVSCLLALICRRTIGGATGDTLGAASELTEAALAACFASSPVLALLSSG